MVSGTGMIVVDADRVVVLTSHAAAASRAGERPSRRLRASDAVAPSDYLAS
jgi:hypothetical protein